MDEKEAKAFKKMEKFFSLAQDDSSADNNGSHSMATAQPMTMGQPMTMAQPPMVSFQDQNHFKLTDYVVKPNDSLFGISIEYEIR